MPKVLHIKIIAESAFLYLTFFAHYSVCANFINHTQSYRKDWKYIFVKWWKLMKRKFDKNYLICLVV